MKLYDEAIEQEDIYKTLKDSKILEVDDLGQYKITEYGQVLLLMYGLSLANQIFNQCIEILKKNKREEMEW